jgi:serine/threonine-protein kinase PknG
VEAQLAVARALLSPAPGPPTAEELARASATVGRLALDSKVRGELSVRLLETALDQLASGALEPRDDLRLLGQPLRPLPLRLALERAYRDLARLATGAERVRLVDLANRVRPRTRR